MGLSISPDDNRGIKSSYKRIIDRSYNTKVALWQIPYDNRYLDYDKDGSKWFEESNANEINEIEQVEKSLKISLSRYKVESKTTKYEDMTYDVETIYPNGNNIKETHNLNHVFVSIKDRFNRIIAEKIFNKESTEGTKTIYKHYDQDRNIFTIVKVYTYDTTVNKKSDIVNFGYTSDETALTKGCNIKKEYYLLNGNEVSAEQISDSQYRVDNRLTFTVE